MHLGVELEGGTRHIDINCDLGESYGRFRIGNDEAIFPYITSCNIACGYHGGDPLTLQRTIELALEHNVTIGAHPSYPDLQGFGRRKMKIPPNELKAMVQYQLGGLMALCSARGAMVKYVKPHGALYNRCCQDREECCAVIEAIQELDSNLVLLGLAGSIMQEVAQDLEQSFAAEAFIDRRYTAQGTLQSRSQLGAVIEDRDDAVGQVLSIVIDKLLTSFDGKKLTVRADSLCIHGDNPHAIPMLIAIEKALEEHRIDKQSFA